MLSRVVLRGFLPYIIGMVIVSLVGAYFYVQKTAYDNGVKATTLKYEIAISEERSRISQANEEALREARIKVAKLNIALRERNAQISQLRQEAYADTDANRPAISLNSVRRINRIR